MDAKNLRMMGLGAFALSWTTLAVSAAVGLVIVLGAPELTQVGGLLAASTLLAVLGLCIGLFSGARSVGALACCSVAGVSIPYAAIGVLTPVRVPALAGVVLGVTLMILARRAATWTMRGGATPT